MPYRTSKIGSRGHQARARARSAVLAGLFLFAFLQAGMGTVIEYWWPELRDPTFEFKARQLARLRHDQKPPATVIFLGSSMTAHGVNAGIMEEPLAVSLGRPVAVYNLGINGNGPISHIIHLQRLLRRGTRPDLVVLEVSPLICELGQAQQDLGRLPPNVLELRDLDVLERHTDRPDLRTDWWQSHLVPIHGHRSMILNQSARVFLPFKERLELGMDADAHGWRAIPVASAEKHDYLLREVDAELRARMAIYQTDAATLKALRELADLLVKERIQTILVVMPAGPLVRSFYPADGLAASMAEFEAVSKAYGFPMIQAHEWYDEEQFRDSYHLHERGATAFSERLMREGIAPALTTSYAARRVE